MKKVKLEEAQNYELTSKGKVTNLATNEIVVPDENGQILIKSEKNGENSDLKISVNELIAKYFPAKKSKQNGEKRVTGASLIREAYDKNPESFDMKAFSATSGIPYARVYGCIKKYKKKKENQ